MAEYSLEELRQLSGSALQHAELIQIAGEETPNKAYELASVRWPRRQAKATRFLAMLRRDHGLEAFNLTVEQARPAGTERAQGEGAMKKLDDVFPSGVRNVRFDDGNGGTVRREPLDIGVVIGVGSKQQLVATLGELKEQLSLTEEQQLVLLVRRVIDAMFAQWTTPELATRQPFYGHMWEVALEAARAFLTEEDELIKKLIRACVIYYGGSTKDHTGGSLACYILPNRPTKDTPVPEGSSRLQELINYLTGKAGFTPKEVRAMWVEMLNLRVKHHFFSWYITSLLEDIDLFDKHRGEVSPIIERLLLHNLQGILLRNNISWSKPGARGGGVAPEWYLDHIERLTYSVDFDWKRNDNVIGQIEDMFVRCVAQGDLATAFYMLVRFGDRLGLVGYINSHSDYSEKEARDIEAVLEKFARAAVAIAEAKGDFGVATALAEHVGDVVEADRLRPRARGMNQRIALNYPLVHTTISHAGIRPDY